MGRGSGPPGPLPDQPRQEENLQEENFQEMNLQEENLQEMISQEEENLQEMNSQEDNLQEDGTSTPVFVEVDSVVNHVNNDTFGTWDADMLATMSLCSKDWASPAEYDGMYANDDGMHPHDHGQNASHEGKHTHDEGEYKTVASSSLEMQESSGVFQVLALTYDADERSILELTYDADERSIEIPPMAMPAYIPPESDSGSKTTSSQNSVVAAESPRPFSIVNFSRIDSRVNVHKATGYQFFTDDEMVTGATNNTANTTSTKKSILRSVGKRFAKITRIVVRPSADRDTNDGLLKSVHGNDIPTSVRGNDIPKSVRGNGIPKSVRGNGLPKSVRGDGFVKSVHGDGLRKSGHGDGLRKSVRGDGLRKSVLEDDEIITVLTNGTNSDDGDLTGNQFAKEQIEKWKTSAEEGSVCLRLTAFLLAVFAVVVVLVVLMHKDVPFDITNAVCGFHAVMLSVLILVLDMNCTRRSIDPAHLRFRIRHQVLLNVGCLKYVRGRGVLYVFAGSMNVALQHRVTTGIGVAFISLGFLAIMVGGYSTLKMDLLKESLTNNSVISNKFTESDSDHDGKITREEFVDLIRKLGLDMGGSYVKQLFQRLDINEEGKIDFLAFRRWWLNEHAYDGSYLYMDTLCGGDVLCHRDVVCHRDVICHPGIGV